MDFIIKQEFSKENNRWEVELAGEIDIFKSAEFKDALLGLIAKNQSDLRLDCKNLEYIDSTGLGALVTVLKKVKDYGGHIYLVNMKQNSFKLFKITNLDKVFIIEGDDSDD